MKEYILKYDQYNVCVYESGSGSVPLVLLHGGGLDSALLSWKEVMSYLSDKYTVYAIDLLGYGKSDRPEDIGGDMFYQKHIACVENITAQLGLDQFCLSGLSMGGAISIGFALKNPDKVKALIPVDSWGLVSKMPHQAFYYWYVNTSLLKKSYQWFAKYRWLVRWSIQYSLINDKSKVSDELIDTITTLCGAPNVEKSMQDYQRSSLTKKGAVPDYTKRLQELAMPVLFINGEKDSLVLTKDVIKASKAVRNGELYIMKGCKHWAQKERPETYAKIVDDFLGKL